jgi:multidrug resistance efflux pump
MLFELDATTILSKQEVADKALAGAEAEYRQAIQQALWDSKAKAQLAIIGGRIEERRAEADYLKGLLGRAQVKAPRAGIVVFDDPSAWLGRPVALGEKVMAVTGETDTEIEAWLAVGDAIPLQAGASVTAFLDVAPLSPVDGELRILGYEAQPRPDGTLGYRLRATIDAGEVKPRVGLKGTARVDGDRVPLAYWLFRKPMAAMRQWLGM